MDLPTLDEVYRKFGEVSEAAQLLETELGTILFQIRASEKGLFSDKRPEEARQILTRIESSALGQILRQLSSAGKLSSRAPELFAAALAERNRLTHSFYRQHNFQRNTDDGRAVMIADLDSIHSTLLDAYKAALAVSGIDLDSIVIDLPTKHVPI